MEEAIRNSLVNEKEDDGQFVENLIVMRERERGIKPDKLIIVSNKRMWH